MDDCGAVLHNIETKWLYDFLTLEKCRNFSQAAVSRNVSQPAFSRRIRALEQAIGVELFNRQVTPLQLSEQGKIFHSQIRHLLQLYTDIKVVSFNMKKTLKLSTSSDRPT